MTTTQELDYCPFCGSTNIDPEGVSAFKPEYRSLDMTWHKDATPEKIEHRPACNNCSATTDGDWNKRHYALMACDLISQVLRDDEKQDCLTTHHELLLKKAHYVLTSPDQPEDDFDYMTLKHAQPPCAITAGMEEIARQKEAASCKRCLDTGTYFENGPGKPIYVCDCAAGALEMRRPTVWSMMHRIRAAMVDDGKLLAGIVEMDETYIGGKPRKSNYKDPDDKGSPRGRGTAKAPVVGAVERGGRVKARAVLKEEMTGADILKIVRSMLDMPNSVLNTDEYPGYNGMNNHVLHRTIAHREGYSRRDLFSGQYGNIHTNTIEGFWAIVKRAVYGQFHHVSKKYLPLYLNEWTFRYNHRGNPNALEDILCLAIKP